MNQPLSRREALQKCSALFGLPFLSFPDFLRNKRYIGACDWSLGATMSPKAFDVAKQIGLNGVQVSYNTGSDEKGLSVKDTIDGIADASRTTGIKISSLAIGELNRTPYKSQNKTAEWVWNAINAAKTLNAPVILMAFFSDGDLRNDLTGIKEVIRKLKEVAPHAEKQGITLGIESYLSAEQHIEIIESVGSSAIKVYYDFRNAADAGHDIFREIPLLGKKLICELHMKENGQRLGEGTLDWSRIARSIDEIGYEGWMQIEWASPKGADIVECYRHNLQYLKNTFSV